MLAYTFRLLGSACPARKNGKSLRCQGKVCNTLPWIKTQLDNGLNSFLLEVDAGIDLDMAIVCIIFYSCEEVVPIGINVFPFRGAEQLPDVW